MNFKYVYLGYGSDYSKRYADEMAGYNKDVFVVSPVESRLNLFAHIVNRIHLSGKVNRVIPLPYHGYWLKWFIDASTKKILRSDNRIFFHISAWYIYRFGLEKLCDYLHSHYPKSIVAAVFDDRVDLYRRVITGFDLEEVKRAFDIIMTYNVVDARQYGLKLTPPVLHDYSDVDCSGYPETDVFFVGQDKGRLEQIYDVYEKCVAHGLKCDFHLIGIAAGRRKYKDAISFGGYIPYEEVLKRSKAAKCILNIVQPGAKGITLRDYEAIGMNKLLMTNGAGIRESDLYTEDKVIWLDNLENEFWKFNKYNSSEEWDNKDKHTPKKYFEWIEEILNDKVKE